MTDTTGTRAPLTQTLLGVLKETDRLFRHSEMSQMPAAWV
ncbi:uncharacterized protein G2W53_026261 [Senna tora]|uniref:Uncharacterized protein n=1 Tax=Senna tora TaxID=362788 RepID=A0A834WIM9_9FABA|nr:uncharacterized protein G2W53_026261 [Senna tora]